MNATVDGDALIRRHGSKVTANTDNKQDRQEGILSRNPTLRTLDSHFLLHYSLFNLSRKPPPAVSIADCVFRPEKVWACRPETSQRGRFNAEPNL